MVPKGTGDIMPDHPAKPEYLRVRDFARLLNLPTSTAYRMINLGQLKAIRVPVSPANPQGVVRIPKDEVDRLLSDAQPIPGEHGE